MHTPELIRRKRDGGELSAPEIAFLVAGITDGSLSDAQVGAMAMAMFLNGLSAPEGAGLTGPALDKHSTGGVGDKVSLLLAPIVAACGGSVPMISGRGLGHTGGTLDKLAAIPGYDSAPTPERFRRVVAEVGCAIVGPTGALAPADRRLYAIRDATATVESVGLICASILAKKLAAGLDGLVMDVKVGAGAFLPGREAARELARTVVEVAAAHGLATVALLTDMDQVLGRCAGNALEVREATEVLRGEPADPRLREVTLALAAELLVLGGLAVDAAAGRGAAERALASGAAAERFARMAAALGGPADLLERPRLPEAPVVREVLAEAPGHVAAIDVRAVGLAVVALGGGRRRESDRVDAAVGLTEVAGLGEAVGRQGGRPLALVHARDAAAADAAEHAIRAAFTVADAPPAAVPPPVLERIR